MPNIDVILQNAVVKQRKETQKIAQDEARRQIASSVVNGQPLVGGMRIMDSASEEILKIILDSYDGNESRFVQGGFDILPEAYQFSLKQEFEKLQMFGAITHFDMTFLYWSVFLAPQGITYFDDKEMALQKNNAYTELKENKSSKKYDVFISHASKDKTSYVNALYSEIKKLGINIFYDSEAISWGDNWKEAIWDGTEKSEFAIIVISENFFGREWTNLELEDFLTRQNASGQKIVLPLLHNISIKTFKNKYPFLENIQVIDTKKNSKKDIAILFAKELIKRLR